MNSYINWIRQQPCVICEDDTNTQAHHIIGDGYGTMGGKAPDELCLPLCSNHHRLLHDNGVESWEQAYGITQEELVCRIIRRSSMEGWKLCLQ